MNPRETVKAAIEFHDPPRIPYFIGMPDDPGYFTHRGTEAQQARIAELTGRLPQDFLYLWPDNERTWRPVAPSASGDPQLEDAWGCRWVSTGGTIRVVSHPLEAGWSSLAGLSVPDAGAPGRLDAVKETADAHRDKYLLGWVWFTLFERMWFLRGFNNLMMDMIADPGPFQQLLEIVFQHALTATERWSEVGVDGIHFSDDWGSQTNLLISPDDWRRIFKPCYRRLFDAVHRQGAHVWFHSCGNVAELLPDFLDIGLDVLNPVQPQAMRIDELARRFGGRLCFNGALDVQGTLVRGTPVEVREEVARTIRTLGAFGGGYVGTTSHTLMPETPPENLVALLEALEAISPEPVPRRAGTR
jgi:uroporphyrinogen decarboxylase